jgi:hypothetical protein
MQTVIKTNNIGCSSASRSLDVPTLMFQRTGELMFGLGDSSDLFFDNQHVSATVYQRGDMEVQNLD